MIELRTRLILLVLLVAALGLFGLWIQRAGAPERAPTPLRWRSSAECRSCHEGVWSEWEGSHHQIAYRNEEVRKLSDDFRNKECQSCHLPRPVLAAGLELRPLQRQSRPDEGIDCLTCHLRADGTIAAARDVADAPCRPRRDDRLLSVALCAVCHNQHKTTDQYHASSWPRRGYHCNDCHMPGTDRGGRPGRGHVFPGAHDSRWLRRAVTFEARFEEGALRLRLANSGAGHAFPTEERSRAADVVVRFVKTDGAVTDWALVRRFRLYYLSEGGRDDTLPADEEWTATVAAPADAVAAQARLWYRLMPYAKDGDRYSSMLFELRVERGQTRVTDTWRWPPPLRAALTDETPAKKPAAEDARLEALRRMAEFEDRERPGVERLARLRETMLAAFTSTDRRLAALARRDLLEQPDAFWVLEEGLEHADRAVRDQAAYELGRLGLQPSIPVLLRRLKYEHERLLYQGDGGTLVWVVDALFRLGNLAGLPELPPLFAHRDAALRELAGRIAIDILRATGVELPPRPTWRRLEEGLAALSKTWKARGLPPGAGQVEAEPLTRARLARHLIAMTGFPMRPIDEARYVLSRCGRLAVPLLDQALAIDHVYLRTHVLEVVLRLGRPATPLRARVRELLDDRAVAPLAVRAAGALGDRESAPRLLGMLAGTDLELRIAAAAALGPMGAREAIPALRARMNDPAESMDLRVQAAFSLALLEGGGEGRDRLEQWRNQRAYHVPTLDELLDRLGK